MITGSGMGATVFGVFKLKRTYTAETKALVCTREYEADDRHGLLRARRRRLRQARADPGLAAARPEHVI